MSYPKKMSQSVASASDRLSVLSEQTLQSPFPYPPTTEEGVEQPLLDDAKPKHITYSSGASQQRPMSFRRRFYYTYTVFLVTLAVGLEVMLHESKKYNGLNYRDWGILGNEDFQVLSQLLHITRTAVPTAVAMFVTGLWMWVDAEIKRLQPYVDLVHGGSPAQRSLLLDYTRVQRYLVWYTANRNKHYAVFISSLMLIVTATFQFLASSVLTVQDMPVTTHNTSSATRPLLSFNMNTTDNKYLINAVGASGYAAAISLFGLDPMPFVQGGYTFGDLGTALPMNLNATVRASTTVIHTQTNCIEPDVVPAIYGDSLNNFSYQIDTKFQNCSRTTNFTAPPGDGIYAAVLPFEPCDEDSQIPRHFWPIYIAVYTFEPSPAISVTGCWPTITLHNASVLIGVQDSTVQSVTLLDDLQTDEEHNKLSQNISIIPEGLLGAGDSFIGLNGFFWDELANSSDLYCEKTIIDQFRTVLWMTAENGPGLDRIFAPSNNLSSIVESLYKPYLAMLARSYYFADYDNVMTILEITKFEKRLSMNDLTVHYLAFTLIVFACAGLAVQVLHRRDSRKLHVYFLPGSIAAAAAVTSGSAWANELDGRQSLEQVTASLAERTFKIDQKTNKIVEDEEAPVIDGRNNSGLDFEMTA